MNGEPDAAKPAGIRAPVVVAPARWRFYVVMRRSFRIVARVAFRFEVQGASHVPACGPVILVAPHRSWLDPACVGGACPRPVRFLILESVYGKPWARWFYRRMHGIPVSPGGFASLPALRSALRVLEGGDVLGVFPEGRVVSGGHEAPVHPGAALLAVRSGAPVVPVAIEGSARAWPHGRALPGPARVRVTIGAALVPPAAGRGAVSEMAALIEQALRGLAPRA